MQLKNRCDKCNNDLDIFKIEIRDNYKCWKCRKSFKVMLIFNIYDEQLAIDYEYTFRKESLIDLANSYGVFITYRSLYNNIDLFHACPHCDIVQSDKFLLSLKLQYAYSKLVKEDFKKYCKQCDIWYDS